MAFAAFPTSVLCPIPAFTEDKTMAENVYKKIEIVGASPNSIEEAVENAIAHASKTIHGLRWFEVTETRGDITDGKIAHWQVTVKIGFVLDPPA
jgi:flavin-binding protein dodecin